jgi:hypothetical protein
VREAFDAQEAFDLWDEGVTFGVFARRREVDLDTVVREWNAANAELVHFVMEHGSILASAMSAFGQDPEEGLEAKPASAVPNEDSGDAQ